MFYEKEVALVIWKVFPPVWLVFGTIGNLMTISILMQRRNRNSSIAKYLTALAVSDLTVLWTALLRNYLSFGYGFDIRSMSPAICKIQVYVLYLSSHCSSWFVVILTIERFISIWLPTKVRLICTPRNASVVIISMLACLSLFDLHFLYGMGHPKESLCYPINDDYANFIFNIWSVLQVSLFYLMPLVILALVNVSIIIRVLTMRRKINPTGALSMAARARKAKDRQVTAMLVLLNIVFMICVMPFVSFLIFYTDWVLSHGNDHSDAVLELIWAILNVLFYTNNAVNFVLYFISRSTFRKQAKESFSKSLSVSCLVRRNRGNVHTSGNNNVNAHVAEMQNVGVFQIRTTRI